MLYTYLGFSNVNMFRVTWGSPEKGDFDLAGLGGTLILHF